jgi:membrane-bound lytic murein transglycosylase D
MEKQFLMSNQLSKKFQLNAVTLIFKNDIFKINTRYSRYSIWVVASLLTWHGSAFSARELSDESHYSGPTVITQAEKPIVAIPKPASPAVTVVSPAASVTAVPSSSVLEAPSTKTLQSQVSVEAEPPIVVYKQTNDVDLWARIRRGFMMNELASDLIGSQEQWYSSRPDYIERMTGRSSKYLYHVVEELERRNMPTELALLPFIESAFNPQAVSSAKAAGMWQFMPSTGKYFSLKQNVFRDDRRDVLASTRAALD